MIASPTGGNGTMQRRPFADLTIEQLGAGGDGIAYRANERVFVPFTVPGDRVTALLGAPRGGGREGKAIEWLERGPGRSEPPCPHFGRCGGCALQHLGPGLYESVKLAGLRGALRRVGLDPGVIAPLQRAGAAARRRIRLGLLRPKPDAAAAQLGLRERFSHALVDLHHCAVLEPELLALIGPLRRCVPSLLPPGGRAEALLTRTDSGVDLLLEMAEPPSLAALEMLAGLAESADLARIVWRAGRSDVPIVERRPPQLVLSGVTVPVPPGAFLQASEKAERLLLTEVVAAIPPGQATLDLYAGIGTFAFAVAREGRRVHAVEGDSAAVAASARRVPQVTVEHRDLARDPLHSDELARWNAAIFNPPRAGALRQAEALALSTIATVVAISCNPATFARDARRLVAGGFRLDRVAPIDQFVWTPHLEVAAVFRR
jgi:23S rRNA (uracil1939-C5)-methyltransferase